MLFSAGHSNSIEEEEGRGGGALLGCKEGLARCIGRERPDDCDATGYRYTIIVESPRH